VFALVLDRIDILSMLGLGLLGTGHCIGMCGPLVFAFPGRSGKFLPHLFYHGGRLLTYSMIGGLIGGLGTGLAALVVGVGGDYLVTVTRIQIAFSLLAALFLACFGLMQLGVIHASALNSIAAPQKIPGYHWIVQSASHSRKYMTMLMIGMLMGFLPCGLSFAAFSRALAAGGFVQGMLMLILFGVGTVPGLLFVGTGVSALARRYRRHSDVLSGMLMIGMSVSLFVDAISSILNLF
jgi:sulfite exporter TauE/SafE